MLGINTATDWRNKIQGPDYRPHMGMPGLDEGGEIPLELPYQARWGNKYTNAGQRMFNEACMLKEYAPDFHPNHYNQDGAPEQMAGIEQSAFFKEADPINGDLADVLNIITARDQVNEENRIAAIGRDHVTESLNDTHYNMKVQALEARHAHLIREGFTEAEAKNAIAQLRQDHANQAARAHKPQVAGGSLEEALQTAFGRVRT